MIIDSHHHFWTYTPEEFGWIDDAMSAIRRDFLPSQLERELAAAGVDGVVTVEARQTLEETNELLALAEEYSFIRGVVGWLPLASSEIEVLLEHYSTRPKLKGIRHVVEAEPDGFLEGEAFNRGVARLYRYDLVYDILIGERQLPEAIRFVDRHPQQIFVLDHLAKPLIKDGVLQPWRKYFKELARRENVTCKISGMVTEADYRDWTLQDLKPYWETALEAFGPQRLMFGSDWPVCLVACEYSRWVEIVREWAAPLALEERAALLGATAAWVYSLTS
jgi:L-fuconolactonase